MRTVRTLRCTTGPALSVAIVLAAVTGCNENENEGSDVSSSAPHTMEVRHPVLSVEARQGWEIYNQSCASCHGKTTGGTSKGPPLIMYDEVHHPDGRFYDAVKKGVPQHHWNFGDMPAVPEVTEIDVAKIVTYVREVQAADEAMRDRNDEQ